MRIIYSSFWFLLAGSIQLASAQTTVLSPEKIDPNLESELKAFFAIKAEQAKTLATDLKLAVPSDVDAYFAAAARSDWKLVTALFQKLANRSGQYDPAANPPNALWKKVGDFFQKLAGQTRPDAAEATYRNPIWQTVNETYGTYEAFASWQPSNLRLFAREIIDSIPPGSIYLGGTDPGRYLITAFSKSQSKGDAFFTVTQNALADSTYLQYLRAIYGRRIYIPSDEDSRNAFQSYLEDAARRLQHDAEFPNEPKQIKPGESVNFTKEGRLQVSGQIAVMAINARLAKVIFEKNQKRELFIEESFPLEWMFPYLTPFGMIMRINRQQIPALTEEMMTRDHQFWSRYAERFIGSWITDDTPVTELCAFAEKTYLRRDLNGFKGDPTFAVDVPAQKSFSKLRSAIGYLYWWRLSPECSAELRPKTSAETARMTKEAEFALRQAYAFCPQSPEALHKYVTLLVANGRPADALLIAETSLKFEPRNPIFTSYAQQLRTLSASETKLPQPRKE